MGNIFGKADDSDTGTTSGPRPPYPSPPVSKSEDGASEVISFLSFNENSRRLSDGAKLGTRFSQKVILPQETFRVLPPRTDGSKHSSRYNQKIDEHSHETIRALPSRTDKTKLGTPFSQEVILPQETIRALPSRTDGSKHSIRYNQKIDEYSQETIRVLPSGTDNSKQSIRYNQKIDEQAINKMLARTYNPNLK